jgi:DNA-binding beta-propeller fold protein YncE
LSRFNWFALLVRSGVAIVALFALTSCTPLDNSDLQKPEQRSVAGGEKGKDVVWPAPPEKARYRLSAVLVGEQTVSGKSSGSNILTDLGRVIAGIAVGEHKYKELQRPTSGLTLDDGSVLVVDAGLKALVRFDFANKEFMIWNQSGNDRGFKSPIAVVEDGQGGYLVSDSELGKVVRLGKDGKPRGEFGAGAFARPTGLARDPSGGAIFVADSSQHVVKKFSPSGELIATIGGPGQAVGRFNAPTYLSFASGRLFVSDTLNFRIQSFDANGAAAMTFGKAGAYVGQFTRPKGVAVGGDGRIYVVESRQDHLLVFDPKGQLLLPIEGSGDVGSFYLPAGVWTDAKNNVYVADMFNGRIIVLKELTKWPEG